MPAFHQSSGPRTPDSSARNGFTLVELLVVVGIIALLLGILFPVLGRAREHARMAQCANHIRQIYHAVVMYANDNKGVLPMPAGLPDSLATPELAAQWAVRLEQFGWINYRDGALLTYLGASPLIREQTYLCPSDEPPRFARENLLPVANPNYPRNFSYTLHGYVGGWRRPGTDRFTGLRFNQIRRPSHKILILEEEMPRQLGGLPVSANTQSDPGGERIVVLLTRRHLGKANEGFFDGHVELFDPSVFNNTILGNRLSGEAYDTYVQLFEDR
jgi:prepilin-type N-terminal cleavage/methylation domain-containing protein/prepilin-type processing-associated H-X9-DG protein